MSYRDAHVTPILDTYAERSPMKVATIKQLYASGARWQSREGDAQYRLGHMHREGEGVLQNFKEALKWYRLAISTGNAAALIDLGEVYADGMSVTQEYVRAHMWFNLAASKLSPRFDSRRIAVEGRDKVAAKMTAVQIERAQEMARKCQESKFKDCGW